MRRKHILTCCSVFFIIICISQRGEWLLRNKQFKIGIAIVVDGNNTDEYAKALASVKCYTQIHGYTLLIANKEDYINDCRKDEAYRQIEEFIDANYDIIFYDRFYNDEIAIGSYIVKNTLYAKQFLVGFANCENVLPNSFHGTENGILHKYIASKVFPDRPEVYEPCIHVYNNSKNYEHLFAYEACIRAVLGSMETFPHIKILKKGSGWVRDSWLTNSMWNPEHDFMFHGLKKRYLVSYTQEQLPFEPSHNNNRADWVDPFTGGFNLEECLAGNTTWSYDPNLISTSGNIEESLSAYRKELQKEHYRLLGLVVELLK